MSDLTVIIATLFRPPTLDPLMEECEAAGVPCLVIEGRRTNHAWNEGLRRAQTRYLAILNDDIIIGPAWEWSGRLLRHFAEGDSYVALTMGRALSRLATGPLNEMAVAFSSIHCRAEPMHKGHAFAFDRTVFGQPVPQELSIYYGDDWFYWHHEKLGKTCLPMDIAFKTGQDVPSLQIDEVSGWTGAQPGFKDWLGEPLNDVANREHEAAQRYFRTNGDKIGGKPVGLR